MKLSGKALNINNFKCHIFRFPNGSSTKCYAKMKSKLLKSLFKNDYTYIDWNAVSNDSIKKMSRQESYNVLVKSMRGKNVLVILMHDSRRFKQNLRCIRGLHQIFNFKWI